MPCSSITLDIDIFILLIKSSKCNGTNYFLNKCLATSPCWEEQLPLLGWKFAVFLLIEQEQFQVIKMQQHPTFQRNRFFVLHRLIVNYVNVYSLFEMPSKTTQTWNNHNPQCSKYVQDIHSKLGFLCVFLQYTLNYSSPGKIKKESLQRCLR